MTIRFALVAGEASGDRLGSQLIESLRDQNPDCRFEGIGGPLMSAAGMECWHQASELAVMGLAEVVGELPRLLRLRRNLCRRLLAQPPDCYIGIDAPDFNLGVERRLKGAGIPTVQYVSPSVWAWRQGRARKIGLSADLILTLFPFEPEIYQRFGANAQFVGHPTADEIPISPDKTAARNEMGLAGDGPLVAVLPGSRMGEVNRLGKIFAGACSRLAQSQPRIQFVSPCASPETRRAFSILLATHAPDLNIKLVDGQSLKCLMAADAALLASGTAALEALLCKTPMVVSYRISSLTHWIVNTFGLMKVERYSLPNALANGPLVAELMQDDANPRALAEEMTRLLEDREKNTAMLESFASVHQQLKKNASHSAAEAVFKLLSDVADGNT